MLIQANSGGGKSWALRWILEQTYGKVQQIILDPEGEFQSLREQFDYVLVGKGADIPTDVKTAKLLARRIMELGISAVIDLYDLKPETRKEFVQVFLTELMNLPRSLWRPLLVAIDEIHVFCPEAKSGAACSSFAVIDLATRGRKRGFCLLGATQRLAKLNKDCAAELLNKLVGRTGLDNDVKRAADELGFIKADSDQLKFMEPGTFYSYGPALSQVVKLVRMGQVKTTHPQPGKIAPPLPAPRQQVTAVLGEFQDLAQEARQEITDIASAKATISKLEQELRATRNGKPAAASPEQAATIKEQAATIRKLKNALDTAMKFIVTISANNFDVRMNKEEIEASITAAMERVTQTIDSRLRTREAELGRLRTQAQQILQKIDGVADVGDVEIAVAVTKNEPFKVSSTPPIVKIEGTDGECSVSISRPQQRILDAIRSFEPIGITACAKNFIAVMAGASPTSGGYSNNLGALRSMGLIDYPKAGYLCLTELGMEHTQPIEIPWLRALPTVLLEGLTEAQAKILSEVLASGHGEFPTLEEYQSAWLGKVSNPQAAILRILIEIHPDAISKDELAERCGASPTSGGYSNNLGFLRNSARLIDYPAPGMVVATPILFPEGL